MSLIEISNVKKSFSKVFALNGVSTNLEAGEQYAIQGSSGSGKSTLLYLLGGLDRPTEGSILIDGKNLATYNDEELAKYRNRNVGFVFQFHFLLPSMNCLDNIFLPAKIGGVSQVELKGEVENLAERLKISHCLKKYPYELSGGEQQRVNIIRALSLKPKILLCDEPTGNLDSENSLNVAQILKSLAKDFNSTLVVVTHDGAVANEFDNQLFMRDGMMQPAPPKLPH
ncbi:MAG: ABC-type lipoprotein export system ATPase subunit [Bacteriovoracaceae bacterium]